MRQIRGSYTGGLHVIAVIMAVSVILPILVSPPKSGAAPVAGSGAFGTAPPVGLSGGKSGSIAGSR